MTAGSSTATTLTIIENCSITGNSADAISNGNSFGGGIYWTGANSYVVVANSKITGNHGGYGGGICTADESAARLVVYGSLIAGNYVVYANNAGGAGNGFYSRGLGAVLANCTIADNTISTYSAMYGIFANSSRNGNNRITLINSVDASNGAGMYVDHTYSASQIAHLYLLRTTTNEPAYDQGPPASPPASASPTFLGALGFTTPGGAGYHSRTDAGVSSQLMEGNFNSAPSFVRGHRLRRRL